MKIIFLVLSFSLQFSTARAQIPSQLDTSCKVPQNASNSLIYLHGMDSIQPSSQELQNRASLTVLANSLNIRIALPRVFMKCPTQTNSICWSWSFTQREMQQLLPLILQARTKCFSDTNSFGMIGFSNGGYLITQWYRNALMPKMNSIPSFFIASGSDQGAIPQTIKSLATNPPLTLIIGNQDSLNRDSTASFFNHLKSLNGKVSRGEFTGGHELDFPSLNSVLNSYLNP